MSKLPISLVVITKNEEANIARCLQSVPFASEILVVDSGSQDRTCEIAKELGARVESREWKGFGPQKHEAAELARYNWILSLDADEALTPELQAEIKSLFAQSEPLAEAFDIPRKSFYLGRWILRGGWYPDYQTRLFHRKRAQWSKARVHEKVEAAQTQPLNQPMEHYVFRDLAHQIETNNRYSGLGAQALFERRVRFQFSKLLLKPASKFIETYFWKAGFLDGLPGFIISVGAAYSVFLKFAKLWELEKFSVKKNKSH